MNALTLFAGAGGADLGLRAAGFDHLACIEADAHASATLTAAGFPAVRAWIGDGPQPERLVRGQVQPPLPVWRHDGQPVDLLWASPPCQPYSRAGQMLGADDERDGWPATLAAIREVRPRWVVVENVVGSPAEAWAGELRALYPHVVVWRANAVDWGLPSRRDRLYVIAGPMPWTPPAPTHYGPDVPWLLRGGRAPWVGFGGVLGLDGTHPLLQMPAPSVNTGEGKGHTCPDRERGRGGAISRAADALYLATGRRVLTPAECAILVGFPVGYPFQGGITASYRQIGNAVAPIMAEVIGRSIAEADIPRARAMWEPCECCPEFYCHLHRQHVYDCPCPAIDEMAVDPYTQAAQEAA